MALITKTAELKIFVPVEANFDPIVFLPDVNNAQEKYLARILGDDLLTELEEAYANSILAENPVSLSAEMKALLLATRKVVAPLAMYEYLADANVRISDKGAMKANPENYEASSSAEIYFARIKYLQQGYTGIASLYRFLNVNIANYPSWSGSEGEARYNEFFIRTAKEFSAVITSIRNSDWIFELMTGYMRDMEARYIQDALTFELFTDIKTKRNNNSLSAYEKELLKKIQSAIAHYTYALVLKTPDLTDEINNVTASRAENFNKTRLESDNTRYEVISITHQELGDASLSDCIGWLNKNASAVIFPLWFNSSKYKNPNAPLVQASSFYNDNAIGTFMAM